MTVLTHSSLEGAQHGGSKTLLELAEFAKKSGAAGFQPSNYHFLKKDGSLMSLSEVRHILNQVEIRLDGISAHCWFWAMQTAWTHSKTIRPFIPKELWEESPEKIAQYCEDKIVELLDLAAGLGLKVMPMFWGVAYGWEVATGYPWGFWANKDAEYDFIAEGDERFINSSERVRREANARNIFLAHEIHPGTAASCADDFNHLVKICDGDKTLTVNADPSHNWEGESWLERIRKVGDRIAGCHVKNHVIIPNMALRCMAPDWKNRPMQFCNLRDGQIDMVAYVQEIFRCGYVQRYCEMHNTKTAPLVVEAESAYDELDYTSADGIAYVNENLCRPAATGSFEDGMGEAA